MDFKELKKFIPQTEEKNDSEEKILEKERQIEKLSDEVNGEIYEKFEKIMPQEEIDKINKLIEDANDAYHEAFEAKNQNDFEEANSRFDEAFDTFTLIRDLMVKEISDAEKSDIEKKEENEKVQKKYGKKEENKKELLEEEPLDALRKKIRDSWLIEAEEKKIKDFEEQIEKAKNDEEKQKFEKQKIFSENRLKALKNILNVDNLDKAKFVINRSFKFHNITEEERFDFFNALGELEKTEKIWKKKETKDIIGISDSKKNKMRRFDVSEEAMSPFGFKSGDKIKVIKEKNRNKDKTGEVVGVDEFGTLNYQLEGEPNKFYIILNKKDAEIEKVEESKASKFAAKGEVNENWDINKEKETIDNWKKTRTETTDFMLSLKIIEISDEDRKIFIDFLDTIDSLNKSKNKDEFDKIIADCNLKKENIINLIDKYNDKAEEKEEKKWLEIVNSLIFDVFNSFRSKTEKEDYQKIKDLLTNKDFLQKIAKNKDFRYAWGDIKEFWSETKGDIQSEVTLRRKRIQGVISKMYEFVKNEFDKLKEQEKSKTGKSETAGEEVFELKGALWYEEHLNKIVKGQSEFVSVKQKELAEEIKKDIERLKELEK